MNLTSRIALISSIAGCVLWAAKSLTIAVAGLGQTPLEDPLFFAGYLALLIAAGALGIRFLARRPWQRPLAVIGGLVVSVAVVTIAGWLVDLVQPANPGWAWGELDLWALGALTLAAAFYDTRRPNRLALA